MSKNSIQFPSYDIKKKRKFIYYKIILTAMCNCSGLAIVKDIMKLMKY